MSAIASADRPDDRRFHLYAVAYSRQSTPKQVEQNIGSALAQQQGQVELLKQLGCPDDRILVLADEGISGTTVEARRAWQQVLQLIEEEKVWVVSLTETSRANRNDRDFLYFVDLCELHDVLILQDGQLLDPRRDEHRMILGVRGVFDVFENRVRTRRMRRALLALIKDKRRSVSRPPRGYIAVNGRMHQIEMHPDPEVQAAIRRVFEVVEAEPTAGRAVRRLRREGARLPNHPPSGAPVDWVEVTVPRVWSMIKNPYYAGSYIWGRRKTSRKFGYMPSGRPRARRTPPADWLPLANHHDGYIDLERFRRIQERLAENRLTAKQPAGRGPALLQGLVACGHCGRRMYTSYATKLAPRGVRGGYYYCPRNNDKAEPGCLSATASIIDPLVVDDVLGTLRGLTGEAADHAIAQLLDSSKQHSTRLHQRVEEARHRAQRARERYASVDHAYPNVRDELLKDYEAALTALKEAEAQVAQDGATPPRPLRR